MSERKQEIKAELEVLSQEASTVIPFTRQKEIEATKAKLEQELKGLEDADQEEAQLLRIQAQEEKVASIQLPYDFNEVFDDPRANEIVTEVIQNFQRQANEEHNAEVEGLIAQHREELRAAQERELNLKYQNQELQTNLENATRQVLEKIAERDEFSQNCKQAEIDLQDANSKRDAAVSKAEGLELLLSEKEAHIQTLRDEAAIGASKTISVMAIEGSDRLSQLVEASKNAKIKSAAEIALEQVNAPFRGKVTIGEVVAPPALEVPTFRPNQLDAQGTSSIPATDTALPEVTFPTQFQADTEEGHTVDSGLSIGDGESETVTRAEFEALKADVLVLKLRNGMVA